MSCKKTSIGGQALIEGIMMRGPEKCVMVVRNSSGEILTEEVPVRSLKNKKWFQKAPIIRGVFAFLENEHIIFHDFEFNAWSLENQNKTIK